MKKFKLLSGILIIGLLNFTACKKVDVGSQPTTTVGDPAPESLLIPKNDPALEKEFQQVLIQMESSNEKCNSTAPNPVGEAFLVTQQLPYGMATIDFEGYYHYFVSRNTPFPESIWVVIEGRTQSGFPIFELFLFRNIQSLSTPEEFGKVLVNRGVIPVDTEFCIHMYGVSACQVKHFTGTFTVPSSIFDQNSKSQQRFTAGINP